MALQSDIDKINRWTTPGTSCFEKLAHYITFPFIDLPNIPDLKCNLNEHWKTGMGLGQGCTWCIYTGVSNQALPTVQNFHGRVVCRELEPGSSLAGQTFSPPFSKEGEEEDSLETVVRSLWHLLEEGDERDCPERLVWFKANYNTHSLIIEEWSKYCT